MMKKPNFELASGPKDAQWLNETLYPWDKDDFLQLGSIIPEGFESYIAIRHVKKTENSDNFNCMNYEKLNLILADYTTDPSKCFYGVWVGFGWDFEGEYRRIFRKKPKEFDSLNNRFVYADLLRLENREYYLLFGDLFDSLKIGHYVGGVFFEEKPNLVWPESKEWFVASEIDFDVTLVGGSKKLINYIELSFPDMTERFTPETRTNEIYIADH